MNALHFARHPMPDTVRDWHRLGELAAQLRDQRARAYPAMIADGRMTATDAATRLRIITAIAAQWDAVLRGQALPPVEDYREALGAYAAEMLEECADIAVRADARTAAAAAALADPENTTVKEADVRRCADQAMLARALHWHQQPINDGGVFPHIWIAHDFHQWQRHSSKGSVMIQYVQSGATISACGNYRYRLWREWRLHPQPAHWDMWTDESGKPVRDGAGEQLGEPLSCVFVMLNPSTADADQDDPTIRRCVAFAKTWGYDRLEVVNLFAWRATDPRAVLAMTGGKVDPVGADNRAHVHRAIERAGIVICAWGAHGGHIDQDETMLGWLEEHDAAPMALRVTKDGFPGHPLYLPRDCKPFPYLGRKAR